MEFTLPIPSLTELQGQFANKWNQFSTRFQLYRNQLGHAKSSFFLHFGAQAISDFQIRNSFSAEECQRLVAFLEYLEFQCLSSIVLCFIRHLFFNHCQLVGSPVDEFLAELKFLSHWCNFDDNMKDNLIRSQLLKKLGLHHEEMGKTGSLEDLLIRNSRSNNVTNECPFSGKEKASYNFDFDFNTILDDQNNGKPVNQKVNMESSSNGWPFFQEPLTRTEISLSLLPNDYRAEHQPCNVSKNISPDFTTKQLKSSNPVSLPVVQQIYNHAPAVETHSSSIISMPFEVDFDGLAADFDTQETVPTNSSIPPLSQQHSQTGTSQSSTLHQNGFVTNDAEIITNDVLVSNSNPATAISHPLQINDITVENASGDADSHIEAVSIPTDISSANQTTTHNKILDIDSKLSMESVSVSKHGAINVPSSFYSQQRAYLKSSEIEETSGQSVDVFSCNFCSFSCPERAAINRHVKDVHKSQKCFVCIACNSKFTEKDHIESHVRTKHLNVEEHKCQICDSVFVSQEKLFRHLQSHAEPRTVSCRVCSAMFTTEKMWADHMSRVHPDVDKWICHLCGETFFLRRILNKHLVVQHKELNGEKKNAQKYTYCKQCDITFIDKASCDKHMRKFHLKKPEKRFQCNFCDHVTISQCNLLVHMRTHTGEKPFVCDQCGKKFAQENSLDKHRRTHTGEKPYKCQYCDASFKTSSNRLVHERTHRKEKPYRCEQCGKSYRNSYDLKTHIITHNALRTKKFTCHCGSAFDTKKGLTRHQATHLGEKPHTCDICGASFTRAENVRCHQKSQACRNKTLLNMK